MGDLTKHFDLSEFQCKSGEHVPYLFIDRVKHLARQLEALRRFLGGKPIKVICGYRSAEHNELLIKRAQAKGRKGPAKMSQHIEARAADIRVHRVDPEDVHEAIESLILRGRMEEGGLGLYLPTEDTLGFVHYDVRGRRARWTG